MEIVASRRLWTLDEYVVVADLYLRRSRSSGIRDPEVIELAALIQRSPASVTRRLGNFDGTTHPGRGLKPVVGPAFSAFAAMRQSSDVQSEMARSARARLVANRCGSNQPLAVEVERALINVTAPRASAVGSAERRETALVARYCEHLDPERKLLKALLIPVETGVLRTDLFHTGLRTVIEAKAEPRRHMVRQAIGQLFDYQRYVEPMPDLAILVGSRPDADLLELPVGLGIAVIWPEAGGFADSIGGELSVPEADEGER